MFNVEALLSVQQTNLANYNSKIHTGWKIPSYQPQNILMGDILNDVDEFMRCAYPGVLILAR